jgi:hypothetical protein
VKEIKIEFHDEYILLIQDYYSHRKSPLFIAGKNLLFFSLM